MWVTNKLLEKECEIFTCRYTMYMICIKSASSTLYKSAVRCADNTKL